MTKQPQISPFLGCISIPGVQELELEGRGRRRADGGLVRLRVGGFGGFFRGGGGSQWNTEKEGRQNAAEPY